MDRTYHIPLIRITSQQAFFSWRRGWDSNPRYVFWTHRRFRVAPVMTTSVPLRRNGIFLLFKNTFLIRHRSTWTENKITLYAAKALQPERIRPALRVRQIFMLRHAGCSRVLPRLKNSFIMLLHRSAIIPGITSTVWLNLASRTIL